MMQYQPQVCDLNTEFLLHKVVPEWSSDMYEIPNTELVQINLF